MDQNYKNTTELGAGSDAIIRYENGYFHDELTGDKYVLVHEELYEELEAIRQSLSKSLGGRDLQS